ncbi:MAG: hypothetical protein ACRCSN_08045 [Dermatophilaceae bacterium]
MILPSTTAAPARRTAPLGWRHVGLAGLTAVTAYSTGVGWQAQLVSYPLYRAVAPEDFLAYHAQYNSSIPLVVIVPGFASFLAGIAFLWTRPAEVPRRVAALVAATGAISLVATVARAIPMHNRLDRIGQDSATIDDLLQANLVRSLALTLGTAALCWSVARVIRGRTAG